MWKLNQSDTAPIFNLKPGETVEFTNYLLGLSGVETRKAVEEKIGAFQKEVSGGKK